MDNEIIGKNRKMFLNTLSKLYSSVAEKDFKTLSINSGSYIIDDSRIIFSFYNDFYVLDKNAEKIFKIDCPDSGGRLKSTYENNENIQALVKKMHSCNPEKDILDNYSSALALSYLDTADGALPEEQWITYRELKDGMFYSETIPKTLKPLCLKFESNFGGFLVKAEGIGAVKSEIYKNAVIINPFKRFAIMFMFYEKDDEFDCEVKVLFDRNANHYLKTDVIKLILVYTINRLIG
jgi:hypothetical protein